MHIRSIYINLPVQNIERTRAFWNTLGFSFNEEFSDVLKEGSIYSMMIKPELFTTFTNRPIADATTTQVLIAIEVESRERVDEIVRLAIQHGGSRYREHTDHGWMYYDTFADPDGHQWEVSYMGNKE
jgi:predicted lactoylglutathione lyase